MRRSRSLLGVAGWTRRSVRCYSMGSTKNEGGVSGIIKTHPLLVFSKTYCPYCSRAKEIFSELGAKAHVVELDVVGNGSALQAELKKLTGRSTVPNVFIAGENIGGCDDTEGLLQSGELQKKLRAAKVLN
eukprot:TRINITY_DN27823_c0_g1_i1.p1 TRINITY_DN27823_c0_g1~~TRINITY_DN27823_c0_g1_i1.p1  ORF type:complete len:130 (+),score=16.99 TRINITY_DN27823_c0_g1_i1:79-468(+)